MKKGVLLLNLGSPDSTEIADVRKYLKEFLMDERVIDISPTLRSLVVNAFILPFRPKRSGEAYAKVWTPEGSPLVVTSEKVQQKVQEGVELKIYLAMRYGNPSIADTIQQMKKDGVEDVLIFPLYPHYAMSSYETVVVKVMEELASIAPTMTSQLVQPFYQDDDYIDALVSSAKPYLEQDFDLLLFSYHGIPERHLRKSDPSHAHCLTSHCCDYAHPAHATCYKHQGIVTTLKFVAKAGIPEGKYAISYQSRLGRDPWLQPYTDFELERFAQEGKKKMLVICPAFVSDCLETLEEIAMEGKEEFLSAGGESFAQIPCLNEHPSWIAFIQKQIQQFAQTASAGAKH